MSFLAACLSLWLVGWLLQGELRKIEQQRAADAAAAEREAEAAQAAAAGKQQGGKGRKQKQQQPEQVGWGLIEGFLIS